MRVDEGNEPEALGRGRLVEHVRHLKLLERREQPQVRRVERAHAPEERAVPLVRHEPVRAEAVAHVQHGEGVHVLALRSEECEHRILHLAPRRAHARERAPREPAARAALHAQRSGGRGDESGVGREALANVVRGRLQERRRALRRAEQARRLGHLREPEAPSSPSKPAAARAVHGVRRADAKRQCDSENLICSSES